MWLSYKILSDMVDLQGINPDEIGAKITMASAEIEDVIHQGAHLSTIIAAKILKVQKHPNADKLTLVDLDTGKEMVRVVCGAPNHKEGDIVPLALPGTKFSEDFVIVASKIRGEQSNGMLCSSRELGFSEEHAGILILPASTVLGTTLAELFDGNSDVRFEIDNKSVTHRPDLWGHMGFAREIGAIFGRAVKDPVDMAIAQTFKGDALNVSIECPAEAMRYCGLVVKNIKIQESPEWLKSRITSIGMRPISNIVDITNYVMAELGEPMHAFDRSKLKGNQILVRLAKQGETLTTLDGQAHELHTEDVVITDGTTPIALAGVMGGGNSEIDDNTTEIVLEAACFNAVSIRKTAHRHNNRTDAAMRYEKSLDPELCPRAIVRCFQLIKMVCPEAQAITSMADCYPTKFPAVTVEITTDRIRAALGADLSDEKITGILTSLGFGIKNSGGALTVDVPSYRATKDISMAADIVEEVGRIYGYDNIPMTAPLVPCATPNKNVKRSYERQTKSVLTNNHGMIEVSNYSFVGEELLNKIGVNEDKELRLRNPLASDQDRLRRSLVPNFIKNIELNARYHDSFRIYELGRAYMKADRKSPDLVEENTRVAGCVYTAASKMPAFYEAKAIVEDLLSQLRIKSIRLDPAQDKIPVYAHPGRSMKVVVEGKTAGFIFELHPKTKSSFDIPGNAALFDLDLDLLIAAGKKEQKFEELPKFPDVPFELSVLAERTDYAADIAQIIERSSKEFVRSVEVFSVYEGAPIPAGKKSVSFRAVFAAKDATLASAQIESLQKGVIDALAKKGYTLR